MRERARERAFDLALWLLLCVPVLLKSDPNDGGSWTRVGVGVAVLAVCVALGRRWPAVPLALVVAASLATSPELFTPSYTLALVAFGYLAGRRAEATRSALWLFAAVPVVGFALVRLTGRPLVIWFALILSLALAVVAPWLIGRYVRQYDRLVRSGWELADRMEREQAAVADRERLRERSRIAGDMHDSLGHDLALIAVRAGALEVDPALGADQQRAAGELRRAAADATGRLRDIIGVLREGDDEATAAPVAPADETVAELVGRARASGMEVRFTQAAGAAPLADMTARAVHRVVQEGLTNAAKHAPGAPVEVVVERSGGGAGGTGGTGGTGGSDGAGGAGADHAGGSGGTGGSGAAGSGGTAGSGNVRVRVTSGPAGPGRSGLASGGTGLVGLDERVRLAGGTLGQRVTAEGGFELSAALPPRPPAPRPAAPRSARELDRARREVRRGLARVIWIPLALLVALGLLMAGVALYTQHQSYLEPEDYARIRLGQTRSEVGEWLPDRALDGRPQRVPAEPPGRDECLYYRATMFAAIPVYRLCFVGGRLVDRAEVP
ncbi:sensor histidine kinase [Streptomyces sp. NPDC054835]|uniref:sensor histidine kinase n=1 Tax=Streptomyces sp. NBC_01268 TaxID=2903806 RepID=UPI002E2EF5A7|nr:histidine kinase [Streptomyces sp. NBC_01268]